MAYRKPLTRKAALKEEYEAIQLRYAPCIGNLYVTEKGSEFKVLWWRGRPEARDPRNLSLYLMSEAVIQYLDCYSCNDFIVFSFLLLESAEIITATRSPWETIIPYGTTRAQDF